MVCSALSLERRTSHSTQVSAQHSYCVAHQLSKWLRSVLIELVLCIQWCALDQASTGLLLGYAACDADCALDDICMLSSAMETEIGLCLLAAQALVLQVCICESTTFMNHSNWCGCRKVEPR